MKNFFRVVFSMVAVTFATVAFSCPSGQYSSFGMCLPEIGGAVGQGAQHLKTEIQAQTLGNPLEGWLIASRNTAINGAQPIPPQIRQALTGYVGNDVMNRVRFKIGDNGVLNLGGLTVKYGDADAITLIDVIVFANANGANDPALWAHELTHVKQFMEWGVHSFAIQYARNYQDVETPAYAAQNGFAMWQASRPAGLLIGQQSSSPPSSPMGNFCITSQGLFGPGPSAPLGSACNVPTRNGVLLGQITSPLNR